MIYNSRMRSKLKIPLILFLIYIFFFSIFYVIGSPYIFSDGYGYYHIGKTIVEEGNFTTSEKSEYYNYTAHAVMNSEDKYVTTYAPGNGILWWPFLNAGKLFNSGTIYTDYSKGFNGHSLSDGVLIVTASIFFTVLGIYFAYKTLRLLGFNKRNSIFSIVTVWSSSFLFGYVFINSAFSHSYEVFALSAGLYTFLKGKDNKKYLILSGLLFGLNVLIRPFNLILIVPFVLYLLYKKEFKKLIYFVSGGIIPAIIFLIYNKISYGDFLTTGYQKLWNVGLSLKEFNLFKLLFSTVRGWFVYTPIALVSILALIKYSRKNNRNLFVFLLPILFTVITYSFWNNWWAGDSIGQRFFIVLIPFISIGISYLIESFKYKKILYSILVIMSLYSISILGLYRFTPTTSVAALDNQTETYYPEVTREEAFTPIEILNYHISLIKNSSGIGNYFENLARGLNGGRSLLMLQLGLTEPLVKLKSINDSSFSLNIIPDTKNRNIEANIFMNIKYKENIYQYTLSKVDTSKVKEIVFDCLVSCSSEGNFNQSTMLSTWIKLNDNLEVSLHSESKINFVDYKLKAD